MISANGMLDPWAMRNSFWKKQFALLLYERRCLERAACIHVSSRAEADSVRHFGFQGSICVIPNGVDCPRPSRRDAAKGVPGNVGSLWWQGSSFSWTDPSEKGLEALVKGWSASGIAKSRNWHLAIVGADGEHETQLKRLIAKLGQGDRIGLFPPMFNELKDVAFGASDVDTAFLKRRPSDGDPLGLGRGLPVIMTPDVTCPRALRPGAAIPIDANPESIADGLRPWMRCQTASVRRWEREGAAWLKKSSHGRTLLPR